MVLRRSQNRGSSVKRSKRQSDDRKTAGYCSEHYAMSLEDPDNGEQIGFEAATTPAQEWNWNWTNRSKVALI